MYKLFLTLRYLRKKRIAVFAILSVWLCVAMVLIVFSVMDGFLDNIKKHSRGLLSDIVVSNATLQGFPFYAEFVDHLKRELPEIVDFGTPVIYNYGILRVTEGGSNFTKPVRVVGIRLNEYAKVNDFRESLYYEKYYPGTTTLGPVRKPVAAVPLEKFFLPKLPAETAKLPPEYDKAFAEYLAGDEHDSDEKLSPTIHLTAECASPHGVGLFDMIPGEPGFAEDALPGVVIGTDVIYDRGKDGVYRRVVVRGAKIVLTLLPLTVKGTIAEDPIPVAMRMIDDSRTRVYDIDKICVYVDFDRVQELLSMGPVERVDGSFLPPRASQLLLRLHDGIDAQQARQTVEAEWERFVDGLSVPVSREDANLLAWVTVDTWEDIQIDFISAVEKEKVLVTALFGVISLVAVVLISVMFYMIVLQKTRDIGIIKSLGATSRGVAAIFLMYGAAVGVVGGILGVISGAIFVHYINDIQDLLAHLNPNLQVWSPDVYTFDRIPNVVKPTTIALTFVAAVVTAVVGAVVPAIRAASVWPVQALRYE